MVNIVEQIDHAIRDWGTSSDAMRWAPELDADIDGAAADYVPLGPVLIDPARVWQGRTGSARQGGRGFAADRVIVDEACLPVRRWVDPATGRLYIAPAGTPDPQPGALPQASGWVGAEAFFDACRSLCLEFGMAITEAAAMVLRTLVAYAEYVEAPLRHLGVALERTAAPTDADVPADPRERALWLRRHRNTGPVARMRVPRRIDPGRSR